MSKRGFKREQTDERCFLAFQQTVEKRTLGLPPSAQMVCFRRKTTEKGESEWIITRTEDYGDAMQHMSEMNGTALPDGPDRDLQAVNATQLMETAKIAIIKHMDRLCRPTVTFAWDYWASWESGKNRQALQGYYDKFKQGALTRVTGQIFAKWESWIDRVIE